MSTSNGAASSDIDPIILKQFLADGLGWIVADEIDAEYLQAHGFAALLHIDGTPLLRKDVQSRDRLVVLSRPDEAGARHAGQVRERLVKIKWAGTLSHAILPEHYFDLSVVMDKHGPEGFGPFIAALAASGLQERFGGAGKGTPAAERETHADTEPDTEFAVLAPSRNPRASTTPRKHWRRSAPKQSPSALRAAAMCSDPTAMWR